MKSCWSDVDLLVGDIGWVSDAAVVDAMVFVVLLLFSSEALAWWR